MGGNRAAVAQGGARPTKASLTSASRLDGSEKIEAAQSAEAPQADRPVLELGLIVTPVLDRESVQKLAHDVQRELAKRYPDISWKVTGVRESWSSRRRP